MADSVTKADLIAAIADEANIPRAQAERALGAMLDTIRTALVEGRKVTLVGFGSFAPVDRAARVVRAPGKGPSEVPAHRAVRFTVGKALKDAVNA